MLQTEIYAEKTNVYLQKKTYSHGAGEDIGYEMGAKMIKNHYDQKNEIHSHFIGREMIEAILDQPGVVGITMFDGINKHGLPEPVLVGVNSNGSYVLNITTIAPGGDILKQKGIVAVGVRCPGDNPPPREETWF